MYAVVAPGFSCIYSNWADVERIKALYPYPKWCKCRTQEEANEWLRRNMYGHTLSRIHNYGNTFENLYIDSSYSIKEGYIVYKLDCSRVGRIRIDSPDVIVKYTGTDVLIKLQNIFVSAETIAGHMSAIYNLLKILGDYIDVNIELPYYCLFYCLTSYSKGNSRTVSIVRKAIDERLGAVALSLRMDKYNEEDVNARPG